VPGLLDSIECFSCPKFRALANAFENGKDLNLSFLTRLEDDPQPHKLARMRHKNPILKTVKKRGGFRFVDPFSQSQGQRNNVSIVGTTFLTIKGVGNDRDDRAASTSKLFEFYHSYRLE
jgi:hypothetical protein